MKERNDAAKVSLNYIRTNWKLKLIFTENVKTKVRMG